VTVRLLIIDGIDAETAVIMRIKIQLAPAWDGHFG
jgi:hypothetical protein